MRHRYAVEKQGDNCYTMHVHLAPRNAVSENSHDGNDLRPQKDRNTDFGPHPL